MTAQKPKMLRPALEYLKKGWNVIPLHGILNGVCTCNAGKNCENPGKHPRISWQEFQGTRVTAEQVREWWSRWRVSNIGIITGKVSGIIVLDVDGPEGLKTLREGKYNTPPTVTAKTGGGGWHYIYKHPGGDCRNFAGKIGETILPNVDFRGDGGLIVAAPSLHKSGRRYEWSLEPDTADIAEPPEWLVKLIREQATAGGSSGAKLKSSDWAKKITEGHRDVELTRRAGSLLVKMSLADAFPMLMAWNKEHCDPPLPEKSVRKIAESIAKKQAATVAVSETGGSEEEGYRLAAELKKRAERDPKAVVKEVLGDPNQVGSLALLAHANQAAFDHTLMWLRDNGVLARDVDALKRAINAEKRKIRKIRLAAPGEERVLIKVNQKLDDAPVPEQAVIPDGWDLSGGGVYRERVKGDDDLTLQHVCSCPVVISGRLRDVANGAENTRISWHRDGRWQSTTVPRKMIAASREIVELADQGVPVHSSNSKDLVEYLSAFEAANLAHLPRAAVSGQLGWVGKDGKQGFLWGRHHILPDGQVSTIDIDQLVPEKWPKGHISFRGSDVGEEQIADGFASAGCLEGWKKAVAPLANHPRALLAIYAALAPPFLNILGAPNFIADWCYGTSTGKTTVLRVAASCWGNPDERAEGSTLWSWDSTAVWVEMACGVLNGLPLILDDTKRARRKDVVAKTLYNVASGRGRGRGSIKGMRRAKTWSTVLLSSGEASAVSFTQDGGTRARVLTLWGAPFGRADAETGRLVQAVENGVKANYGEPGKVLVQWLLQNRDKWPKLKEGYQAALADYLDKSTGNSIAGRLAAYFAVMLVAADIAHVALDLPWDFRDPVAELWEELILEAEEGDRAGQALALVYGWAQANQKLFWGRHATDMYNQPVGNHGYAGRWDREENWEWIGFFPHIVKKVLEDQDFEVDPILRIWREREWIDADADRRRMTKSVRYDGQKAKMIVVKREALENDE